MGDSLQILVVDDNLAAQASADDLFYDRTAFLEDYKDVDFEFLFCSAWDEKKKDYSALAVLDYLRELRARPAVILLDVRFGEHELLGLEILRRLQASFPTIPVVMMTSTAKHELWQQCVALGALDYLVKPMMPEILRQTLTRYSDKNMQFWLVGQAEGFLTAVDQAARAAEGGMSSILLLGASGTGKELFARYIHRHGVRRNGPFQAVHIPSIPDHLVEAELFGYSRGAFTGAVREEEGRLLKAHGGVLFLDEVGDLAPSVQAALLRVLETREVPRLGDGRMTPIDVQVVAATHANLAQRVKENTFRLDLYSRLATTVIYLPTLSERLEDLQLLTAHLLRRALMERSLPLRDAVVPDGIVRLLRTQTWAGNLRELWNYVQRVLDLARKEIPRKEHFELSLSSASGSPNDTAAESPQEIAPKQHIRLLPQSVVKDASSFLHGLLLQELSLLCSALELTRDPVTGNVNRAKAAALLKGKGRCSTNDFDRWMQKIIVRLNPELAESVRREISELEARPAVQGRNSRKRDVES
jgi:DNA-binding NtrC family response regulator